ncbi:hypothetical protein ACIQJW_04345 [Streptomyces californicus]|uniref:hypothetical protein n=1 Tax=Streptomyces TaxID=1883 RepID=UPI00131B9540|nr:hypothetical protein [Streptomyces sp. NRRL F-2295]
MTITMAHPEDSEEPCGPNGPPTGVTSQIIWVTPEIASSFLSRDSLNRRLNAERVAALADAIRRKEWRLTHQGIAFDETGSLLDGQHRLHAIVEAGIPVQMYVFHGLPREIFPVLDTGKPRSGADTLLSTGAKHRPLLSSTIRHVTLFNTMPNEPWRGSRAHVSNDRILSAYNADRDRYTEAVVVSRELSAHLFASPTAVAASYFVTTYAAPAANLDDWVSGLKSGASLEEGDARLALREVPRETQKRGPRRRMTMQDQMAIYIKAWNAWVDPQRAGELHLRRLRKGEKMPIPVQVKFRDTN